MLTPNILLVQLYSNGDCLYATAVARQIKNDFPNCKLTWAIASFCKQIIDNNPFVDEVLEVKDVEKLDIVAYRKFKKRVLLEKKLGKWSEVFFTNLIDDNQANYDGCTRASTFLGYPSKITVPIQPVLNLRDHEKSKVDEFVALNNLKLFKHRILFEFAPQSGQSRLMLSSAIKIAELITLDENVAIILSSAHQINHISPQIIDGSSLSLRETAALTHFCTFLLGTSSGITWISTSSAAKQLPMIQLLDSDAIWSNPVSRDFRRYNQSTNQLIELVKFDIIDVDNCVKAALVDFTSAKEKFNQDFPLNFRSTRFIVYNLLTYFQFRSIVRHIAINQAVHGHVLAFYKEVAFGFIILPFRLINNTFKKKILRRFKK